MLREKGVLPVSAEHVLAVFDLIDDGGQFAVQPFAEVDAEDFADAVGGQAPQTEFTAALEDLCGWGSGVLRMVSQ